MPHPQVEAERNLSTLGSLALDPVFFPRYWLGLRVAVWPNFGWTDGKTPGPDIYNSAVDVYRHWGSFRWAQGRQAGGSAWCGELWQLMSGSGPGAASQPAMTIGGPCLCHSTMAPLLLTGAVLHVLRTQCCATDMADRLPCPHTLPPQERQR